MSNPLMHRWLVLRRIVRLYVMPRGHRRWRTIGERVPEWDERNELIAGMIAPGASILDLGCGARTIREHAKAPARYVGCDVEPADADIHRIDLNAGDWPAFGREFDVVVMSGVLEYLDDVRAVLPRVHDYAPVLLTSYQDLRPDRGRVERRAMGWVNHLSREEIESAFKDAGWLVSERREWNDSLVYALREREPGGTPPQP